jgi:hypothetical protein
LPRPCSFRLSEVSSGSFAANEANVELLASHHLCVRMHVCVCVCVWCGVVGAVHMLRVHAYVSVCV